MNTVIDLAKVTSVYSGRANTCACGCAGKHTYASKSRVIAGKTRGYDVTDDEVSDVSVKRIVTKMNKILTTQFPEFTENDFISVTVGKRMYVAYMHLETKP